MSLARTKPLKFSPAGTSDAIDATNVFAGAMMQLKNLIPDPTTKNIWQCRPAAQQLVDFSVTGGFIVPGFISCIKVVGNRVFGMMATGLNPGYDQPFCFDLKQNQVIPISGATSGNTANVPRSPPTIGDWTPPIMDVIGTKIVIAHPGYSGTGTNFFGVIDISNPASFSYDSHNTSPTQLAAVPVWVAQFSGRAYFGVNPPLSQPAVYFSDVLLPTQITNANQILTFGDNLPLTTAVGLPLSNQLGGIIQSLMVFKGNSNIFQVIGDAALNTLSVNTLNVATGTLAPLSTAATSKGVIFAAPDGIRLIDFTARVSDPIGVAGAGINLPFINPGSPSRISSIANSNVIRISVQNLNAVNAPFQEWWYDLSRQTWSGPHSFPNSLIDNYGNTFIMTPQGVLHSLWQSDVVQSPASQFTENGVPMTFLWQSCMLPDTAQMSENAMVETTLNVAMMPSTGPITVRAFNEMQLPFDGVTLVPFGTLTLWNQFNWNQAQWNGSGTNPLFPRRLNWHAPIVFRRLSIAAFGQSGPGIQIGDLFLRYEELGYLQQDQVAAPPLNVTTGKIGTFDNTVWPFFDSTMFTMDRN